VPGTFFVTAVLASSLLSPATVRSPAPNVVGGLAPVVAETPGVGSPGDALGLSSGTPARPARGPVRIPLAPASGAGIGAVAIAGAALARRRRWESPGGGPGPLYVYVPGHGGDPDGFDDLAGRIGLGPSDIRVFDYRWAWPSSDAVEASRHAPAAHAADALSSYLAALGASGRPIYLVGHSKGGAVITEVIGRWDEHPSTGVDAVVGATILDPPISKGPLGLLQSLGWLHGETADDGLFNPVRCRWNGCRDIRDGLGERSGVEVVIVRNPDAALTNFRDRPDRVRVYDLDDGGGSMFERFPNLIGMWQRMGEAHNSVLHSDTVADCIAAEAQTTGSCEWPKPKSVRSAWGRGRSDTGPLAC